MRSRRASSRLIAAALAAALATTPAFAQSFVPSCPATSSPTGWAGGALEADTLRDGVTFSPDGGGHLELSPAAGLFRTTSLSVSDLTVFASAADFDQDGWTDFVGVGEATSFVRVYRNRTFDNPAPDWDDPDAIRTPKFVSVRELQSASASHRWRPTVAADFNGDGWPDVLVITAETFQRPASVTMWLNRASNDTSGNPRFNTSYSPLASGTTAASFGYQTWGGSNIIAYDYNNDRKLDLIVGSGENGGEIRVFLNQCTPAASQPPPPALIRCSNSPTFARQATPLITNLGFGTQAQGGLPVFTFAHLNGDTYPDLVVGAPNCCANAGLRLRFYPGKAGGGVDTDAVQSLDFVGAATGVFAADFSLDGRLDLIVTSDNWNYAYDTLGGMAHYYVNNGNAFPFAGPPRQRLTDYNNPTYDYDVGFVIDYDNDPAGTPDLLVADGNHTGSYYILTNRVVKQYVPCGEVASGVIPLGDLAGSEMVVTGARLQPDQTLNGGSITYYLSNEVPPNWVQATPCPDGTGDLCVTFPRGSGRDVRWKAVMCSNATRTETPVIRSVSAKFDYTQAREHYRAGVIVHDGVSYVGAFRQPGDRGRLYAINAGLNQTYWEASAKLDAMADSARRIYTAHPGTGARLDFRRDGATVAEALIEALGAAGAEQAATLVDWVRSARFGVGNVGIALSKLGAVESSTPAILTRPTLPVWYVFASAEQRAKVDQFLQAQANRRNLVLFGSKDGMIHAVHSLPTDITNPKNGQEAWAFIPSEVAGGFAADHSASLGASLKATRYPDGSPTLADVADAAGDLATIAIVAAGNGGKSVTALDVTATVDPDSEAVSGPRPLWSAVPGGAAAGQAYSKVAVARARIGGQPRFVAIAATGIAFDDLGPDWAKGRIVTAFDALTGAALWRFRARCPVTSDVGVFETDDELEPGAPRIDGFVDRVVFADRCGHVYKLDPGRDLGGGWNGNAGLGSMLVDEVDGVELYALFSTKDTTGALGEASPIAGTLGAQVEAGTNRMVLFFGTGGLESHPIGRANEFYAVYADTGAIRSKLAGACTAGRCEKFYGGVVVTQQQVLFTRTVDPEVGGGACDRGTSVVQGVQLNAVEDGGFIEDFRIDIGAAVMGALYGDAGAIYFATIGGQVARIGEPRAADAGGDSGGGGGGDGGGPGAGYDPDAPMTLMAWRQVF